MNTTANETSNELSDYWDRLNAMDPRVKEVILRYSDEYVTGRWGNNWRIGVIEYELWALCQPDDEQVHDVELFKKFYKEAYPDHDEWAWEMPWNLLTFGYNQAMKDLLRLAGVNK